jgi:hypothetical protein
MNHQKGHTWILYNGHAPILGNPTQGAALARNGIPIHASVISADHNDNPYITFASNFEITRTKHVFRGNGIATLGVYGRGRFTLYTCGDDFASLNPAAVFPILRNGRIAYPGQPASTRGDDPYSGIGSQIGDVIAEWNFNDRGDLILNTHPNIPNDLYPQLYPEHVPGANPWLNTYFKFNRWTMVFTT